MKTEKRATTRSFLSWAELGKTESATMKKKKKMMMMIATTTRLRKEKKLT